LGSTPVILIPSWSPLEKALFALTVVVLGLLLAHQLLRDTREGLSAMEMGLLNLKDGEFSTTLSYQKEDELGNLCSLYNQTVHQLRDEKHWLYQRELLLDKITQTSPEVLFLVNDQDQIVFSNIAARHFFKSPKGLEGKRFNDLLKDAPEGAGASLKASKQGLFSIRLQEAESETWHMSTGNFLLNNQAHTLFILKQMTRELSRQEVAVWKKVIRIISHELNNSLGPISSMLHSGQILSNQLNEERLSRVFVTIEDRIQHLTDFVQGYGKFAKLPEPKIEKVNLSALFKQLSAQWQFSYPIMANEIWADPVQLEQLLINLLKNAHESGSPPDLVSVAVETSHKESVITVSDRGKGVPDNVINNVLIPFYSTKANGSGLGLALCREIVDAHHGHISLHNQSDGGLAVRISLPFI
jgi:nitrogen fixation/metabolism regulation signal transduction histidine kinase